MPLERLATCCASPDRLNGSTATEGCGRIGLRPAAGMASSEPSKAQKTMAPAIRTDPAVEATSSQDDLSRVQEVPLGPVDVFSASCGAASVGSASWSAGPRPWSHEKRSEEDTSGLQSLM